MEDVFALQEEFVALSVSERARRHQEKMKKQSEDKALRQARAREREREQREQSKAKKVNSTIENYSKGLADIDAAEARSIENLQSSYESSLSAIRCTFEASREALRTNCEISLTQVGVPDAPRVLVTRTRGGRPPRESQLGSSHGEVTESDDVRGRKNVQGMRILNSRRAPSIADALNSFNRQVGVWRATGRTVTPAAALNNQTTPNSNNISPAAAQIDRQSDSSSVVSVNKDEHSPPRKRVRFQVFGGKAVPKASRVHEVFLGDRDETLSIDGELIHLMEASNPRITKERQPVDYTACGQLIDAILIGKAKQQSEKMRVMKEELKRIRMEQFWKTKRSKVFYCILMNSALEHARQMNEAHRKHRRNLRLMEVDEFGLEQFREEQEWVEVQYYSYNFSDIFGGYRILNPFDYNDQFAWLCGYRTATKITVHGGVIHDLIRETDGYRFSADKIIDTIRSILSKSKNDYYSRIPKDKQMHARLFYPEVVAQWWNRVRAHGQKAVRESRITDGLLNWTGLLLCMLVYLGLGMLKLTLKFLSKTISVSNLRTKQLNEHCKEVTSQLLEWVNEAWNLAVLIILFSTASQATFSSIATLLVLCVILLYGFSTIKPALVIVPAISFGHFLILRYLTTTSYSLISLTLSHPAFIGWTMLLSSLVSRTFTRKTERGLVRNLSTQEYYGYLRTTLAGDSLRQWFSRIRSRWRNQTPIAEQQSTSHERDLLEGVPLLSV